MKAKRIAALVCLAAAACAPAFAQQTLPRTADGHPDFGGAWSAKGLTPFERIPAASALVVGDEEQAKLVGAIRARARSPAMDTVIDPNLLAADVKTLMRVNGQWRTSWVTNPPDGKLPLTDEGKRQRDFAYTLSDPETRDPWERCLVGTGRAPLWSVPVDNLRQFVQTPGHLMIYTEEGEDTRIIGIGAKHRPPAITSWVGDSVANWDGDTLVVDTLNERDNYAPRVDMTFSVRQQSHIVERFSLISADEILYRFTIEDPALYPAPWSAEYSLKREHVTVYENGCHEGNYSLPAILQTARLAEEAKAKPATKPKRR